MSYNSTTTTNQLSYCFKNKFQELLMNMILEKVKLSEWDYTSLSILLDNNMDDFTVYTFLRKNNLKAIKKSTGYYHGQTIKKIISDNKIKVETFLDFGAGEGLKTEAVKVQLGLKKENVFALDLKDFHSVKNQNKNLNYIYYDGKTIPTLSKKIDLITIIHVLHHIPDVENIIEQLKKFKDCYFIIKEHDCYSDDFAKIIDIEHALYEIVYDGASKKFLDTYYAKYFSEDSLIKMFINKGFKQIKHINDYYDDFTRSRTFIFYNK